ncbi:VapE domain-containing protein [Ensifer adhaerens]|uniref:VapE domain-containing protein n=1 Tax=Ensifer adhaerens TaxID=106592 RepID=UPI003CFC3E91
MTEEFQFPEPQTLAAISYLQHMVPNQWDLAAIPPDGGRPEFRTFTPTEVQAAIAWIEERQGHVGLYYHVNEIRSEIRNRKATKADIARVRYLHVDIDVNDDVALQSIRSFVPAPTTIVFSGGGYQALWKLREPSIEFDRVEHINMAIALALGGDKCHNVDRLLRLPGTINLPNAKKRTAGRVPVLAKTYDMTLDSSRIYSLDDFPQGEESGSPKNTQTSDPTVVPLGLEVLPPSVSPFARTLIEHGDDPKQPRNTTKPHFRSRSEAVFRAAGELARNGCSEGEIAGVLINPELGISQSILEKKRPAQYALRQARKAIEAVSNGWPNVDRGGKPAATLPNTVLALRRLGLSFSHDLFRHRKVVNGYALEEHQGEITDDACAMLRATIIDAFNFDPRAENVRDAVTQLCLEHAFHPIRQFLVDLIWDEKPRLDDWMITYLGAEDTELNRAIGKILLVAAVRRVREPGVKFDTIVILEGRQGTGKSTALQVLAGPGNHSDNEILTLDTKAQIEAMEGVWIFELSEMSGLNKSEVERMKAFASRNVDRARMSYGRFSEARGRQTIFVGTTNEHKYLKDRTGNRRFLPVKTGVIDLEALRSDRDQLWAETAALEAQRASITLPQELWATAAREQEERLEDDPWLEKLAAVNGKANGDEARVLTADLLGEVLGIPFERQHNGHSKRLAALMRELGWETGKFKLQGKALRGFRRPKPSDHIDDKSPVDHRQKF